MIINVDQHKAGALADVHAQAFDHPWDEGAFRDLLTSSGVLARADDALTGFVLLRIVADEAEILTLAVAPASRRAGLGRRLVEAAQAEAAHRGVIALFLEVAADNHPALALYENAGFEPAGRRAGYYARPGRADMDALVLKKPLRPPA